MRKEYYTVLREQSSQYHYNRREGTFKFATLLAESVHEAAIGSGLVGNLMVITPLETIVETKIELHRVIV